MEIIRRSFITRMVICIFDIFCLCTLIYLILFHFDFKFELIFIVAILLLTFYFLILNVKYILNNEFIILKYPFIKEKKYNISDIIGLELYKDQGEELFIVYFDKMNIKIKVAEYSYKEKLILFYKNYYKTISNIIIEKINTIGYNIYTPENKITFYSNRLELFGKANASYFYDKDIKYIDKIEFSEELDLITNKNEIIKLEGSNCKGGIGLFDFLKQKIKIKQ